MLQSVSSLLQVRIVLSQLSTAGTHTRTLIDNRGAVSPQERRGAQQQAIESTAAVMSVVQGDDPDVHVHSA